MPEFKPKTEYARLALEFQRAYLGSELRVIGAELNRVWSTMTDEQKRDEPLVMKHHIEELKADDAIDTAAEILGAKPSLFKSDDHGRRH